MYWFMDTNFAVIAGSHGLREKKKGLQANACALKTHNCNPSIRDPHPTVGNGIVA